jgi:hypothetical protein
MLEKTGIHGRGPWIAAWIYFAAIMLAYSVIILTAQNPPLLVDYPDWVYQGVLFHGVLTGHAFPGYVLKLYPVPNSATTIGLGLLDGLLPWQWAAKVWVCLYLALATFSAWIVLRAFNIREWRLIVALPAILFLNLDFWYGHISFEIGTCLLLVLLAMLKRNMSSFALGAMLILLFFTHMEACAGAILLLLIWCLVTRCWQRLWATIPVIILTVWYAIARFSGGNVDTSGLPGVDYPYGSQGFMIYKANTFFKIFGYVNSLASSGLSQSEAIFGKELYLFLVVCSLIIALLCWWSMLRLAAKAQTDNYDKIIFTFFISLVVIAIVLPQIWLGVADPGSRLLLMAIAAGLLLIDWRKSTGLAIACLNILFCLMNLWQFARVQRNPQTEGRQKDLPSALIKYGHVEPSTRISYYEMLERGEMDEFIFPTAMFHKTSK